MLGEVGTRWFEYTYCLEVCGVKRLYFIPSSSTSSSTPSDPEAPGGAEVSKFDSTFHDQMSKCWSLKSAGK